MLPSALIGVYAQYKSDTNAVAGWLASTAKACGCDESLRDDKPDNRMRCSKRLVNKAKLAKKVKPGKKEQRDKSTKQTIPVDNLVHLAKYIATSADPPARFPASVARKLNRVIALRKGFAGQLHDHGVVTDAKSDATHSYFVGVLEKVREILSAISPNPEVSDMTIKKAETEASVPSLTNVFSVLNFYEPSQDFIDAPDIEHTESASRDDGPVYEVEMPDTLEDAFFAFSMMLIDIGKLRDRITWLWVSAKRGDLDVAVAAIATNIAINLAREIFENVGPAIHQHEGGIGGMIAMHYRRMCKAQNIDMSAFDPNNPAFEHDDTYDIATRGYFSAHLLLESFGRMRQQEMHDDRLLFADDVIQKLAPSHDSDKTWTALSPHEKFEQDRYLVFETLADLFIVTKFIPDWPVEDEMLRGVREWSRTGDIPFYLVFATQVSLDLHHALRDDLGIGFRTMKHQIDIMAADYNAHEDFHKSFRHDYMKHGQTKDFEESKNISWIISDKIHTRKQKAYKRKPLLPMPACVKRHRFLLQNPVMAGTLLFKIRAEYHENAIDALNHFKSAVCSNHLYRAIRSERLLKERWPDMDAVTELLGEDSFFVGGGLTRRADYNKRFELQLGISATAYSKRRDNVRVESARKVASRGGAGGVRTSTARYAHRVIKDAVPVSRMFFDRYVSNEGSLDWTCEDVNTAIARNTRDILEEIPDELWERDQRNDPVTTHLEQHNKRRTCNHGAQNNRTTAPMGPQVLVGALAQAMQGEVPAMSVLYLHLHRSCWTMLRQVREEALPRLYGIFPTRALVPKEFHLPFIVGDILRCESAGTGYEMLEDARPAFEKLLLKDGDVCIRASERLGLKNIRADIPEPGEGLRDDGWSYNIRFPCNCGNH